MNETDLSRENRHVMCADGQGSIGTGCGERNGLRVQNYTPGGISATLDASYYKGPGARNGKEREFLAMENADINKQSRKYIVRRLTPLEATRLQGLPDGWFDGAEGSDSAKYKALGNGLALPCAYDVMNRIARFVEWESANDNLSRNNPKESQEIP